MTASIWAPNGFSPEVVPLNFFEYTATPGQTVYSISPFTGLYDSQVAIYVSGRIIETTKWSFGGTNIILTDPAIGGEFVRINIFEASPGSDNELPSQVGNGGKYLSTDGTTVSWQDIPTPDTLPAQAGNNGKFLTTDGTVAGWSALTTDNVGYTAPGVGAVFLPVTSELNAGVSNVMRFIPNTEHSAIYGFTSTYDCRTAWQNAINALGTLGGTLRAPRGLFEMSDSAGRCLYITCPIQIEGDGRYTVIQPKATISSGSNIIHYAPSPGADSHNCGIRRIFIGNTAFGTRYGSNAIYIDTTTVGAQLAQLEIANIFVGRVVGNPNAYAIAHVNVNSGINANGGLYGSSLHHNILAGGISLNLSGDSIDLYNNVISGETIGIYANMVPGASQLAIDRNNITSTGGAIVIDHARRLTITQNNIEQTAVGALNSAQIYLRGLVGKITNASVRRNNVFAFTGSGIIHNVLADNADMVDIEENSFLPASAGTYGVSTFGSATNVNLGARNQYGTGSALRTNDGGGVGAMNVWRDIPFQNGWANFGAGFATLQYMKKADGMVEIKGEIAGGTAAPATIMAGPLPADCMPLLSHTFSGASQNTVPAAVLAQFIVTNSGNIVFNFGDNARFSVACQFQGSTLATVVSDL